MDSFTPSTLEEVERLIQELYTPGPPQNIAKIQETLQKLQRSPHGWQLGDSLLRTRDEKSKFFGALTLTVKLNSDSQSLNAEDAKELLNGLITHLIQSLAQNVGPLVIRKLCSTLVVYFLHFPSSWPRSISHLIYSLGAGKALPQDDLLQTSPDMITILRDLDVEKCIAVLWFSANLADEVSKTDANNIKHYNFHNILRENVVDLTPLLANFLGQNSLGQIPIRVRQEAMKTFHSWVLYSHRAFIDTEITLEPLKMISRSAIACLIEDEMYGVTVELFSDVLGNYSRFLSDDDFDFLFTLFNSEWASDRYNRLIQGDFAFDSLQFGNFMLAFGDATVQDLVRKPDASHQQFLTALETLLAAEGIAVGEDQIFVPAVEFWSTFVEVLVDSLYSEEENGTESSSSLHGLEINHQQSIEEEQPARKRQNREPWFQIALSHVTKAIEHCWRKIQYPPAEIFDDWDTVEQTGFAVARMDVIDILQASYTLFGATLCSMFANMTLRALEKDKWAELEASLACLGGLSDELPKDDVGDLVLSSIFRSKLFTALDNAPFQAAVRARKSALKLIGEYDWFFKLHEEHLPGALTFLFGTLASADLAPTASKSIQSLCLSCRENLIGVLPAFLHQYGDLTSKSGFDGIAKERVLSAIAAIIQALPTEEEKERQVNQLLQFIDGDVHQALYLLENDNQVDAESIGLEALRCIASIARGLQAPTDFVVDLTASDGFAQSSEFWLTGKGNGVQIHIQTMIKRLLDAFPNNSTMIEVACTIFRAGFAEKYPGPCVFSPTVVVSFLVNSNLQTPSLAIIINTASSFISSHFIDPSVNLQELLNRLCLWLLLVLQALQEPANEPELAQAGIDFFYRLLPAYANILMEQSSGALEFIFMFTLKALIGKDPLPKSAAADFWAVYVSLENLPEDVSMKVKSTIEHFGPTLAEALIFNLSGHAARSELDKLCDPLRRLVARQVHSKRWLETALLEKSFGDGKATGSEKRVFLQKISNLRGAKQTNQVVRDFWLTCRGTSFAYAS